MVAWDIGTGGRDSVGGEDMWAANGENATGNEDRYEPGGRDRASGGDRWVAMHLYTERQGYESFKVERH